MDNSEPLRPVNRPTIEREAELIAQWRAVLLCLIEYVEDDSERRLDDERAALGMLSYLASERRS